MAAQQTLFDLERTLCEQGLSGMALSRPVTDHPELEVPLAPPEAEGGEAPEVTDENKAECAQLPCRSFPRGVGGE